MSAALQAQPFARHISAACAAHAGQGRHKRPAASVAAPIVWGFSLPHHPLPPLPCCRVVGLLGKGGYADAAVKVEWMKAWHVVWRVSAC